MAFCPASSMWRIRMRSSLCILHLCLRHNLIAKISAEILSGPQINFSAQHLREFDFHACHVEKAGYMLRIKFHKEVYVAFRPEILT